MLTLESTLGKAALPFCIGMILALPALWSGMAVDDYWHWAIFTQPEEARGYIHEGSSMFGFADGDVARTRRFMDLGAFPWWTLETVKLSFWRPLTFLTHRLDYALWPASPWMMHLHSLFWWAGSLIVVTLLYRRFLGVGWVAGLAALLYAVDDGHSFPVGWIANRNALIASFFGLFAILLHHSWRARGQKTAAVGAVASLFLGLLGKEEAIATTAFLFAYAIFLDRGRWRARMLTLAPYALAVVVWRSLYQIQGYGSYGSATYLDPVAAPIAFSRAVIERFPVLLLAQWTNIPAEPFIFLSGGVRLLWIVFAAMVLGIILMVLLPVVRRDATAKFFLVGMALAALPACATFPSDRLLLISGFGAMGLVAIFFRAIHAGFYRNVAGTWAHRGAVALAVVFVLSHLIIAPVLLPARIYAYGVLGSRVAGLSEGVPPVERGDDKTLVIIDAPNAFFTTYLPIFSAHNGQRAPLRVWSLAPQTVTSVPLTVTRIGNRALEMAPSRGFDWFLFRDDAHPFAIGDRVELEGRTVEVLEVSERGVPLKVVYHFERSLDDPHFVWLYWDDDEFMGDANEIYKSFTPPRVGQTIQLNSG